MGGRARGRRRRAASAPAIRHALRYATLWAALGCAGLRWAALGCVGARRRKIVLSPKKYRPSPKAGRNGIPGRWGKSSLGRKNIDEGRTKWVFRPLGKIVLRTENIVLRTKFSAGSPKNIVLSLGNIVLVRENIVLVRKISKSLNTRLAGHPVGRLAGRLRGACPTKIGPGPKKPASNRRSPKKNRPSPTKYRPSPKTYRPSPKAGRNGIPGRWGRSTEKCRPNLKQSEKYRPRTKAGRNGISGRWRKSSLGRKNI
eukprot:gene12641-biopygen7768